MPIARLENGAWSHPSRLPLGCGWSGQCTAPGHEGEVPAQNVLEESCNLGYAATCIRLPQERAWDAVRFAVSAQRNAGGRTEAFSDRAATVIQLDYVCEREHRPVEHGQLEFDAAQSTWPRQHPNPAVQKMAECFLESYRTKRKWRAADGTAGFGEGSEIQGRGL